MSSECSGPLAQRQEEQARLIAKVERSLQRHSTYLQAVGLRLTRFYHSLALAVEADRASNTEINDTSGQ